MIGQKINCQNGKWAETSQSARYIVPDKTMWTENQQTGRKYFDVEQLGTIRTTSTPHPNVNNSDRGNGERKRDKNGNGEML